MTKLTKFVLLHFVEAPNVSVPYSSCDGEGNYTLDRKMSRLDINHSDRVCLNVSATSYPSPQYMWSYYNRSDMHYVNASSNPCFFLIANEVSCVV